MPRSLETSVGLEVLKDHANKVFAWMWELEVDATPTIKPVFHLTDYSEVVTFNSELWYPYPITHDVIVESGEGDLGSIDVTIQDTIRALAPYFWQGSGFMRRPATGYAVLVEDADVGYQIDGRITGATVGARGAVFRVAMDELFRIDVPFDKYNARRCGWEYAGEECGYVLNAAAGFPTCPKTIAACIARGNDMAARNLPRLQPMRFGGELGIPQG